MFQIIIVIALVVAVAIELRSLRRYKDSISQQKLEPKIANLKQELNRYQAEDRDRVNLGYSSWLREHFLGKRVGNEFALTVENNHYILLKYPAILARSIPKSSMRFVPGILISIGVIGTFYGMQSGLSEIPTETIADNSEELLKSSTVLLEGMKTAFSSSLAGLICSCLLSFTLALTERARRKPVKNLRSELDKIAFLETPGHFLSRLNLDSSSQAAESIGQVAESLSQLVQNQSNLTSEAIGQEVGKAMSPVFTEIRDELKELKAIKEDNGAEIIKQLFTEQREQLIEPIINELKTSAQLTADASEAVRSLKDELGVVTQSLAESIDTIQNFQKDTLGRLEDFATNLQGILSEFRTDTQGVMEQVATEIKTAVAESVEAMESQKNAFKESADEASQTFRGIREDLQAALKTQADTEQQLMEDFKTRTVEIIQTQTETITTAGQEASQLMDTARENLTATLTNIDTMLQQTRTTVQEELEQFRLNYQSALQEFFSSQNQLLEESLGEQRQGLAAVVDNLNQAFTDEYQRRQTLNEQVDVSLEKVTGTVKNVSHFANAIGLTSGERLEQIKEISRTVGDEARQVEKAYSNLIERLNEGLETSNQHLVKHLEIASASEQKFFEQADEATTKISNQLLQAANYLVSAESHNRNTTGV